MMAKDTTNNIVNVMFKEGTPQETIEEIASKYQLEPLSPGHKNEAISRMYIRKNVEAGTEDALVERIKSDYDAHLELCYRPPTRRPLS